MSADHEITGTLGNLLGPYALLGGLTSVLLCATHGTLFLTLKSTGPVLARARRTALALAPACAASTVAFVAWTLADSAETWAVATGVSAAACACLVPLASRRRAGAAFAATASAIALLWATLFLELYPNVVVSSTGAAYDLTIGNAASGSYTLKVITAVAALMIPAVLTAQAWTYWVFRARVRVEDFATPPIPLPQRDRIDERDDRAA